MRESKDTKCHVCAFESHRNIIFLGDCVFFLGTELLVHAIDRSIGLVPITMRFHVVLSNGRLQNVSIAVSHLKCCQNWFQSKLEGQPNGIIRFRQCCKLVLQQGFVSTPWEAFSLSRFESTIATECEHRVSSVTHDLQELLYRIHQLEIRQTNINSNEYWRNY